MHVIGRYLGVAIVKWIGFTNWATQPLVGTNVRENDYLSTSPTNWHWLPVGSVPPRSVLRNPDTSLTNELMWLLMYV